MSRAGTEHLTKGAPCQQDEIGHLTGCSAQASSMDRFWIPPRFVKRGEHNASSCDDGCFALISNLTVRK